MGNVQQIEPRAQAEATELLQAISAAETTIISTIERECEALRAGRMLAARALHTRLCDTTKLYLEATRAARTSIQAIEELMPGSVALLEESRSAFSAVLKIELAVLATHRAAAGAEGEPDFAGQRLGGASGLLPPADRPEPQEQERQTNARREARVAQIARRQSARRMAR